MNVADELDVVQARLLDDGQIWTRTELLDWWNDAYMDLCMESAAVRRFWVDDVPGRVHSAYSQEWEARHASGRAWRFTNGIMDATRGGVTQWEAEFVEGRTQGVTSSASLAGITQPWERCFSGDTDKAFRFVMARWHDKTVRVAWDNRFLPPVAVKQLDALRAWHRETGQPLVWTAGKGRAQTFEVFEVRTDYQQAYKLENGPYGMPRKISGTRTYSQTIDGVANEWAYSSPGDALSFSAGGDGFNPTSAVTANWERSFGKGAYPYRFTMLASTDSWDRPSLGYAGTQPWEIGNRGAGRQLGTQLWEVKFGTAAAPTVLNTQADDRPQLLGLGVLFTSASTSPSYQTDYGTVGTFSWEVLFGATVKAPACGVVRGAYSASRQYLGLCDQNFGLWNGIPREWHSMDLSIAVHESYVPDGRLAEEDSPELLPEHTLKYIRYGVLARAFGRQGEGYQPQIADHYAKRYTLGVRLMQRLLDVAQKDRDWTRIPYSTAPVRPPRVRYPSTFPRTSI